MKKGKGGWQDSSQPQQEVTVVGQQQEIEVAVLREARLIQDGGPNLQQHRKEDSESANLFSRDHERESDR